VTHPTSTPPTYAISGLTEGELSVYSFSGGESPNEAEILNGLEFSNGALSGNISVTAAVAGLEFLVEFINGLANTDMQPTLGTWERYINADFGYGTQQLYRLATTTQIIMNHVQGTAGTPQTFQLRKVVGANEGTFTMRRSGVVVGSSLPYNVSLATLQAQHADFTITDQTTYFQFTRTSNGSNGTWTCISDTANPVRNSISVTFERTQIGGPDIPAVNGNKRALLKGCK
jgi:hypothetical protein